MDRGDFKSGRGHVTGQLWVPSDERPVYELGNWICNSSIHQQLCSVTFSQTKAAKLTLNLKVLLCEQKKLVKVSACFFFLCLQNQSRWKAMSEEALKSVTAPGTITSLPPLPPLCAPSLDPAAASNQLELEMRCLVSEHRKVKQCWTKCGLKNVFEVKFNSLFIFLSVQYQFLQLPHFVVERQGDCICPLSND